MSSNLYFMDDDEGEVHKAKGFAFFITKDGDVYRYVKHIYSKRETMKIHNKEIKERSNLIKDVWSEWASSLKSNAWYKSLGSFFLCLLYMPISVMGSSFALGTRYKKAAWEKTFYTEEEILTKQI